TARVLKQPALSHAGDEQVRESVIVVVADRNSHAVHLDIEAGAASDVREGSVAVVVVEAQRAAATFVAGPVHSVHQQNVLPAVVIVIEKGAPGAQRLGQIFFAERAAVVPKVDPGA